MTLQINNYIYVSTISDLGGNMLKLDMLPGEYMLKEFLGGYILCTEDYDPNRKDLIQIFNYRDGHKGLSGTYHNGETKDNYILHLFNKYIYKKLSKKCLENLEKQSNGVELYDESDGEIKLLPNYNNIPVIFYLNTKIYTEDINKLSLQKCKLGKLGNVARVLLVNYLMENKKYENIGIMVHQENLFNMMGDQAGIALLHDYKTKTRGLGNFNVERTVKDDSEVYYSYHEYFCSFKPCNCIVQYE